MAAAVVRVASRAVIVRAHWSAVEFKSARAHTGVPHLARQVRNGDLLGKIVAFAPRVSFLISKHFLSKQLTVSVKRKGGVLPVVGFSGRPENPTFTLDEFFAGPVCRARWVSSINCTRYMPML